MYLKPRWNILLYYYYYNFRNGPLLASFHQNGWHNHIYILLYLHINFTLEKVLNTILLLVKKMIWRKWSTNSESLRFSTSYTVSVKRLVFQNLSLINFSFWILDLRVVDCGRNRPEFPFLTGLGAIHIYSYIWESWDAETPSLAWYMYISLFIYRVIYVCVLCRCGSPYQRPCKPMPSRPSRPSSSSHHHYSPHCSNVMSDSQNHKVIYYIAIQHV